MQDLAPLFQIVIVIAAVVSPILLISRFLRGNGPVTLAWLFYAPDDRAWPRGVPGGGAIHFVFGGSAA